MAEESFCSMPNCEHRRWSSSPFCGKHLIEAVSVALPKDDQSAFWNSLDTVFNTLTYKEREILKLRHGFGDGYSYTHAEIARIFKNTTEGILTIEAKTEKKLEDPVRYRIIKAACAKIFSTFDLETLSSKKNPPAILLQSVVEKSEGTSEGQIVEAVSIPWFMIAKLIEKHPSVVYQIDPRKWEELIAGWYTAAGFDEVILTPRSSDFGRDVIAVKYGMLTVRVIDQVKAYKEDLLVPANDVRALLGVLQADQRATKGFVTTTSDFAPRIADDPFIAPFLPFRLELINGSKLIERIKQVADKRKSCDV
ncbi:MAG: restriction endonuclease [Gemmataceae bacterium]